MLLLPAAALCCLCSVLVAMAAQLVQDHLTLTRRRGGSVSFSCGGTDGCDSDYIYWFQKKDSDTFRVILDIDKRHGDIDNDYNHTQKDDFKAVNDGKDEPVLKPVVSVYPAATGGLEGSGSLLCLASHMFPPRLRFSWKIQKEEGGSWAELGPEAERLQLTESGRSASILLHRPQSRTDKYRCVVEHEGGTVEAHTAQGVAGDQDQEQNQNQEQVKLLCLLSTVLIAKSLVYCFGLSVLQMLRTNGADVL